MVVEPRTRAPAPRNRTEPRTRTRPVRSAPPHPRTPVPSLCHNLLPSLCPMPPHTRSTVAPLPTFVPDFFTWAAQANKFCKKHSTCAFCKKHSTFLVLCAVLLACAFQLGRAHERLSSLERLTSLNTRLDLCESQKLSLRKSYALALKPSCARPS